MLARHAHRSAIVCVLACALLAAVISEPAGAREKSQSQAAALAQERYYSSYGQPPSIAAALAQEQYYMSYGEPEPLTLPQSPTPADDTPWLPIALSLALAFVLAVTTIQLRRLRVRRRAARTATWPSTGGSA